MAGCINDVKMSFTTDGGATVTLNLPDSIYLNEPASGNCIVSKKPPFIRITPVKQHNDYCKVKCIGKIYETNKNYQQNFTVTCSNGSASSVEIQCLTFENTRMPEIKVVQGKLNTGITT